jgi:hypothetical protein
MGRTPTTLSDAQMAEVETLAAVLTAEQVADYFGIARRTFYALMERDEEIAARYKRGKARAIGAIAQGLINKARSGDTASMIFFLKTQAGWRETAPINYGVPEPAVEEENSGARARILAMLDEMAARQAQAAIAEHNRMLGASGTPVAVPATLAVPYQSADRSGDRS